MGEDKAGWYYVDGQLRYKDGAGWTDQYKPIAGPRSTAQAVNNEPTPQAKTNSSRAPKAPRRKTSPLVIAVCAGLLGFSLGGGLLNADAFHGWVDWATVKASQIHTPISPPALPKQAPTVAVK